MNHLLTQISPLNKDIMKMVALRQNQLVKPIASLGMLEEYAEQIAGITEELYPRLNGKAVVVFASDNGVWEEGVSPVPQSVTAAQAANMTYGKTGISVLCAHADANLYVVDVGIKEEADSRYIIRRNIRKGTDNIAKGPAMSRSEAIKAMEIGAEMAQYCFDRGAIMVAAGEMGIGNTTTSSAVLSALTGHKAKDVTGKGGGVSEEAYANKISVIERAIALNAPDPTDAIDVISKVGGFDLAAMTGFYLGAASLRRIVVIDGFIAVAAALCAARMHPLAKDYMFLSHRSAEPGYDPAAKELGLKPMFDLRMRLGEGTGCPFAFHVLEASVRILRDMATFEEGSVHHETRVDIRENKTE